MKRSIFCLGLTLYACTQSRSLTAITQTPNNVMAKSDILGLRPALGFMPYKDKLRFLFIEQT